MTSETAICIDSDVDRLLFVSDLHGYREPLNALDAEIDAMAGRTEVVAAGDLIMGGLDAPEAVQWVRDRCGPLSVRGNHDSRRPDAPQHDAPPDGEAGSWAALTADLADYLACMPDTLMLQWRGASIRVMHGSRSASGEHVSWLANPDTVAGAFCGPDVDLVVVGHTHFPFVRELEGCLVANCGSVSLPIRRVLMKDGSVHYQSGAGGPSCEDSNECTFVCVEHTCDGLRPEIVRFDYDRRAALARFSTEDRLAQPIAFKEQFLLNATVDLRIPAA